MLLIHGNNIDRSAEFLTKNMTKFADKFGEDSVVSIKADRASLDSIANELLSVSMFSQNKLVVIKYLGENQQAKELIDSLKEDKLSIPDSTSVIFWENKSVDKRGVFYKHLKSKGKVEEFQEAERKNISAIIKSKFREVDIEIKLPEIAILIDRLGEDLWRIDRECEKLINYSIESKVVTKESIELVVPKSSSAKIWDLVDSLGNRNKKQPTELFGEMLSQGEDVFYVFSMITRQFRLLIQVAYLKQHTRDKNVIAKKIGAHPYVVSKVMSQADTFSLQKMKIIYDKLVEIDYLAKTGQIDMEYAIDLLLISI